jgi:tetratricopeptide (TPR) repeat protein
MRDHWSVGLNFTLPASLFAAACAVLHAQALPADQAYRQGSDTYRAGNCPEAVRQLAPSQTPRASLLMGRCYLDMGDFAKAQTALQHYNQTSPGDEEVAILIARAAEGAGNAQQAVSALEEFRKQKPGSLAIQDALAEAYAQSGKPEQATPLYRAVLAVEAGDIGALAGLAEIAFASSQWQSASEQYKKLLALSPDNAAANAGVGRAELQLGHADAAIPYLLRATRLRPGDFVIAKALANCYIKAAMWKDAIQVMEYDSVENASDEEVTGWMAQAFGHTGNTAQAEQYYRAVLQHAANNFPARLSLGDLLYQTDRRKEAKEQYILVLKARPQLYDISDRVGQIAEQEENLPEAIQYYAHACASPNATTAMKARLARLYFRTGDLANARTALEAVLQADPENREIKTMLMQAAVKTDRPDDAARYANELLPGDPKNIMLLRLLAEDALRHNNSTAAADYLERAEAANEKDRDLRFELVTLYTNDDSLDRLPRAFDLMNEYVGLYPDDYEGYLLLANLYRRKGDAAAAYDYFNRGFGKMPPNPPARMSWAYNSLGLLLLSQGKYEDALANQLKAVELNPTDATAVYNLALTYLKLRRKEEAIATRDKLAQMNAPDLLKSLESQMQKAHLAR